MAKRKNKYDYMMDQDMAMMSFGGDIEIGDAMEYASMAKPIVSAINPVAGEVWGAATGLITAGLMATGEIEDPEKVAEEARKNALRRASFQTDSKYQRMVNGGAIINDIPTSNAGTDTVPVDKMGSPITNNRARGVAMVDSGEVVKDGFVYSNQLKDGKKSFADMAREIMERYKMRLGKNLDGTDKVSKEQMDRDFADLADRQERYKEENGIEDNSEGYASGGKIQIAESKRGTFTSAAERRGMGVQEFASHVMANKEKYSPAMVKKANFAKNTAGWDKKWDGGGIDTSLMYGLEKSVVENGIDNAPMTSLFSHGSVTPNFKSQESMMSDSIGSPDFSGSGSGTGSNWGQIAGIGTQALTLGLRAYNIAKNAKSTSPTGYGYVPKNISLAEQRSDLEREANIQRAQSRRLFSDNTTAQIASNTAINTELFKALNDSTMKERTENAYNQNRAAQFNAQARMQADEVKAREQGTKTQAYDALLRDASSLATGALRDKNVMASDTMRMKLLQEAYRNYTFSRKGPDDLQVYLRAQQDIMKGDI